MWRDAATPTLRDTPSSSSLATYKVYPRISGWRATMLETSTIPLPFVTVLPGEQFNFKDNGAPSLALQNTIWGKPADAFEAATNAVASRFRALGLWLYDTSYIQGGDVNKAAANKHRSWCHMPPQTDNEYFGRFLVHGGFGFGKK